MPSGFLGNLVARRPQMIAGILALGCVALSVVGHRQDGSAVDISYLLIVNLLAGLAAPLVLSVVRPKTISDMIGWTLFVVAIFAGGYWAHQNLPDHLRVLFPSSFALVTGALVFLHFNIIRPLVGGHFRLIAISPIAITLGAAGGIGLLAFAQVTGNSVPLLLIYSIASGTIIGAGSGFDFARFFARGSSREKAAAAAAHASLAPGSFATIMTAAAVAMLSYRSGFGALDWHLIAAAAGLTAGFCLLGVVCVAGALGRSTFGERVAVDENYTLRWFARAWGPLRRVFPPTTAIAATAIAIILAIIAAFEAGLSAPVTFLVLCSFIAFGALVAFVSVRTSLLLIAVLSVSVFISRFAYSLIGVPLPTAELQIIVVGLVSLSLVQLTTSWRDANLRWRNARDAAQDAMGGGLRKAMVGYGLTAATISVVGHSLSWPLTTDVLSYYLMLVVVATVMSPIAMIALSDQTRA